MKYITKEKIEEFYLHDSTVREIYVEEDTIRLVLDSAWVSKDHPDNPHGSAQCIKPCEFDFSEVQEQLVLVWNEDEHKYMSHPEPTWPIQGDIMQFEVKKTESIYAIKITGFHIVGWTEWMFTCASVTVSWSNFAGKAWYES